VKVSFILIFTFSKFSSPIYYSLTCGTEVTGTLSQILCFIFWCFASWKRCDAFQDHPLDSWGSWIIRMVGLSFRGREVLIFIQLPLAPSWVFHSLLLFLSTATVFVAWYTEKIIYVSFICEYMHILLYVHEYAILYM
jgi:hypothetical protein